MEHLSLEQLPETIDQHNLTADINESVVSIESFQQLFDFYEWAEFRRMYPDKADIRNVITFIPDHILGVFSFETYQTLYEVSRADFIRVVFKNTAHLRPHQLSSTIKEYNENADKSEKINSIESYVRHYRKIKGALHPEVYRWLYYDGKSAAKWFFEIALVNITTLSLQQLPLAIKEHNRTADSGKKINSLASYRELHPYIEGALAPETYQTLYDISEKELIEIALVNITTLSLQQLPLAIKEHNRTADSGKKINSLTSYKGFHPYIEGALAPETYQTLYGISEEEFVKKAGFRKSNVRRSSRTSTRQSTQQRTTKENNENKTLTLEQLPSAIEEHNKQKHGQITSFERYQKYHHRIEGALSFEEYQTSHEITEEEFVRKVFGSMEHLTPNQLSDTIREFRTKQGARISTLPTYRLLFTQIKGALTPETYQTLYGITEEEFINLIKNRCETEFTRI